MKKRKIAYSDYYNDDDDDENDYRDEDDDGNRDGGGGGEKVWRRLQIDCGLTELQLFQIQDQHFASETQRALRLSASDMEEQKRLGESNKHFDEVFIPMLRDQTSLTFEQFCVVLVRGFSQRCGACAMYRDKRFQSAQSADEAQDPLFDFCPHLVCTEWAVLARLRAIGKVFWQRFLKTRVGRNAMLCFPQCKYCLWTNLFDAGASEKRHGGAKLRLPMTIPERSRADDFTPKCLCTSADAAKSLRDWCTLAGCAKIKDRDGSERDRVAVYKCNCAYSFK